MCLRRLPSSRHASYTFLGILVDLKNLWAQSLAILNFRNILLVQAQHNNKLLNRKWMNYYFSWYLYITTHWVICMNLNLNCLYPRQDVLSNFFHGQQLPSRTKYLGTLYCIFRRSFGLDMTQQDMLNLPNIAVLRQSTQRR